ncbi:MAG TPA: hypothetical protein PKL88_03325 [bacterium]|nr:hypothetical protein [bacterium]HPD74068.1 hypothetical protein [bacterium]HRY56566.1 hypothetical protein [Patescibacteria group bacterium]
MTERYSNQRSFEDIKKFLGEIKTRVDGIEENETLQKINLEESIKLLVEEIIELLYNEGEIEANNFYALPWKIRKGIKNSLRNAFGIDFFEDENSNTLFKKQ